MPAKKTYKKRTYKKKAKKAYKKGKLYKRPDQFRNGVPQKLFTKLDFQESIYVNVGAAVDTGYIYQTSLWDPYAGVGGHQPLYYDQIAGVMYGNYRCFGFSYYITAVADNPAVPINMVTFPSPVATLAGNLISARERPGSKYRVLSGGNSQTIKGYITVAKTLGVSKEDVRTELSFSAAYNASPAIMANLITEFVNLTATAVNLQVSWKLRFYCEFWNPLRVSAS